MNAIDRLVNQDPEKMELLGEVLTMLAHPYFKVEYLRAMRDRLKQRLCPELGLRLLSSPEATA